MKIYIENLNEVEKLELDTYKFPALSYTPHNHGDLGYYIELDVSTFRIDEKYDTVELDFIIDGKKHSYCMYKSAYTIIRVI